MPVTIVHKNSATSGLEPTNTQLVAGELGVNYNAAGPFLTLVDTNNVVRRVAGVLVSATAPGTPTAGELWLDTSTTPAAFKIYQDSTAGWTLASSPTTNTTISVNNSNPALRITQAGTGAALLVEGVADLVHHAEQPGS